MIKISAPISAIRSNGELRDLAIDLFVFGKIISIDNDNNIFPTYNIKDSSPILRTHIEKILSAGGEIEDLKTYIKVSDLSENIPEGLPYSEKEGGGQKVWQDLEYGEFYWNLTKNGNHYISSNALNGSYFLKGSEMKEYLNSGVTVLTPLEISPVII